MSGAIAALLYERCYNTALAKLGSIDPSASPLYTSEPAPCIQASPPLVYKRAGPVYIRGASPLLVYIRVASSLLVLVLLASPLLVLVLLASPLVLLVHIEVASPLLLRVLLEDVLAK